MPTKENKVSWLRKLGWRLFPPKKFSQLIERHYPVELVKGLVYYENVNGELKLSESSNAFINKFKLCDFRKSVMFSEVVAGLDDTNDATSAALLSCLKLLQASPDLKFFGIKPEVNWDPEVIILNKPVSCSETSHPILRLAFVKSRTTHFKDMFGFHQDLTLYFEWDYSNETIRELRQTIISESERGYEDAWGAVTDPEVIEMSMAKAKKQFELFLRIGII